MRGKKTKAAAVKAGDSFSREEAIRLKVGLARREQILGACPAAQLPAQATTRCRVQEPCWLDHRRWQAGSVDACHRRLAARYRWKAGRNGPACLPMNPVCLDYPACLSTNPGHPSRLASCPSLAHCQALARWRNRALNSVRDEKASIDSRDRLPVGEKQCRASVRQRRLARCRDHRRDRVSSSRWRVPAAPVARTHDRPCPDARTAASRAVPIA